MTVRVVTDPTEEPLTLDEVKIFLREEGTDQDPLIEALISVCREYAEGYTNRALVTQTLELTLPRFPYDGVIEIPRPPLQSVSWVKYVDYNGVLQTVDPSVYQVDTYRQPGQVKPTYLHFWEWMNVRSDFNAIQVRYVAGYAAASGGAIDANRKKIPASIKHWMKLRIANLYENRDTIESGLIVSPLPRTSVDAILDRYRVDLF